MFQYHFCFACFSLCVHVCVTYWKLLCLLLQCLRFMSVPVCIYLFLAVYMHEYRVFQCYHVSLQHGPTPRRSQCQSTLGSINRKKEIFLFLFEHCSHATARQPHFAWHKTNQVWSGRTPTLKGYFTHLSLTAIQSILPFPGFMEGSVQMTRQSKLSWRWCWLKYPL